MNAFDVLVSLNALTLNANRIKIIPCGLFGRLVNLQLLKLQQNEIVKLEVRSFDSLPNLNTLFLFENKISKYSSFTFSNLTNLAFLNLSHNKVISIERNAFTNIPNLSYLDLSHNYLDGFNEFTFEKFDFHGTLYLDFNYIQTLGKHFFAKGLSNLKEAFLTKNGLKTIEDFSFQNLIRLENLVLDFNLLANLKENSFFNLTELRHLSLKYNVIANMKCIRVALTHLSRLHSIDLSNNLIEIVSEADFDFSLELESINLNSNLIQKIHPTSFRLASHLRSFKCANNRLKTFDMSLLKWESLVELDLSFNWLNFNESNIGITKIASLKLENVSFQNLNYSFFVFLNANIEYLDLSANNYLANDDFLILNSLLNIKKIMLRSVGLKSMERLNFGNFQQLEHLDLSSNNLTELRVDSFERLRKLKFLDLSNNHIAVVNIFKTFTFNEKNPLEHLNLDNNRILAFGNVFTNYFNLKTLRASNNFLNEMPEFNLYWSGTISPANHEFYFNRNSISAIKYVPIFVNTLVILNFDDNLISFIEHNAFTNLKSLQNVSISKNYLLNISANNFNSLFSLKYLNLSWNRIESIEQNSFINLNKLIALDVSFNRLKSFEPNVFRGLSGVQDLNLVSAVSFQLNSLSLSHLTNIGNIYLNESTIREFKCLFINFSNNRVFTRIIKHRYKFFKSINLLADDFKTRTCDADECALKLHLFQFRIHLNLRVDYENELFYETCGIGEEFNLIQRSNDYNHNYKKCFHEYLYANEDLIRENSRANNVFLSVFSDYNFFIVLGLILSLLGPLSCLIVSHLNSTNNNNNNPAPKYTQSSTK